MGVSYDAFRTGRRGASLVRPNPYRVMHKGKNIGRFLTKREAADAYLQADLQADADA